MSSQIEGLRREQHEPYAESSGDHLLCPVREIGGGPARRRRRFDSPLEDRSVTHRVISVRAGIKTRGDNNSKIDPWTLSRGDIVGQVILARRDRRYRHIYGGRKGRLFAALARFVRFTWIARRLLVVYIGKMLSGLGTGRKPPSTVVNRGIRRKRQRPLKHEHKAVKDVPDERIASGQTPDSGDAGFLNRGGPG
jgi:hypothetical protein